MTGKWITYKLADLSEVFTDGDWIESKDQSDEGIRLIQTGNIGVGVFKDRLDKARYISEDTFKRLNCEVVLEGDILVSRLPEPVGRACVVPELSLKAITAVDCTIIRIKPELVNKDYLKYFLQSQQYQYEVNSRVTGTTRQRISRKNLGEVTIVIPPLPVQKQIVEKLDAAFADIDKAISATEKNIENAEALFQRNLDNNFSHGNERGKKIQLAELGEVTTGSTPKTSVKENYGSHMPFIKPGDFNLDGSLDYYNEALSEEGVKVSRVVSSNSVLMVCIGATIGKTGYSDREICTNQQINSITLDEGTDKKFLYFQMNSIAFQEAVIAKSGQATLPIINKTKWKSLDVCLPDLEEQIAIRKSLEQSFHLTTELKNIWQEKLQNLEALKSSILNQAFSGELTKDAA